MKKKFIMHSAYANDLINNFTKYYANPDEKYIKQNFNWQTDHVCVITKDQKNNLTVVSNDLLKLDNKQVKEITKEQNAMTWINFSNNEHNQNHEVLIKKKFELLHVYQGMVLQTKKWKINGSLNNPHIKVVENQIEVKAFTDIIENTFDLETIVLDKYLPIHEYNLENKVNRMILVKDENNKFVGTGNIYFDDQHAIIDDISVLVEARGKGYAKMIMFYLISHAKQIGKSEVLLFGTEDGTPVYEKLGFKLIDTYMEVFFKQ
ncbi:hypothetical protein MENTO_v1c04840 [Mesoplasma entomophilum]|uniref:N-acetyltransferase domain-containing protein n=1 Tax=Mesoplasma entomophilum TaxID=2149 RepID=A0A3S5Y0D9_9MOLU|nr:GNAT family N-acetyltransferase [Mesoplasma entomophilum]ATQ35620.1 hypothetical protein CS528_02505 [Mesoplasma entomophilum]ATZ19589.1 hypothetical protein MENTO_v1c04840 [Mesoplasma entomophilum]